MKKAIRFCWGLCIAAIGLFVVTCFAAKSDVTLWRVFTVMVILLQIGFFGALILISMETRKKTKEIRRMREAEQESPNNE